MNEKQRLNRELLALIVFIFGILIMCSCVSPKATCPTYDSAIRGIELKKKKNNKVWNSDFCHVKKKKRKSIF
jgi:hypothetical protein